MFEGREGRRGWWDGRMERRNPPGIYDSHYHAIAQQPPPGALTFMGFSVKAALTTYLPPVIVKSLRRHCRPRPRPCHSLRGPAPPRLDRHPEPSRRDSYGLLGKAAACQRPRSLAT